MKDKVFTIKDLEMMVDIHTKIAYWNFMEKLVKEGSR